jgi:hypothetical protein
MGLQVRVDQSRQGVGVLEGSGGLDILGVLQMAGELARGTAGIQPQAALGEFTVITVPKRKRFTSTCGCPQWGHGQTPRGHP